MQYSSLNDFINKEPSLIDILNDLGIKSNLIQTDESPNKVIYHINLVDITKLSSINKIIKYISAILHTQVTCQNSQIAHLAISVPRTERKTIKYSDDNIQKAILKSKDLSILLGVDNQNVVKMAKLEDLPHLLIAGTTGSGKSVLINNIICSLLQQQKKHKLEIALIDPKQVELSKYEKFGITTATSIETSINLLEMANALIDKRYSEMKKLGIEKVPNSYLKTIIIIDEYADLIMKSRDVTEDLIVRIAQLGRACGVHLILSTQRPSADIVTGLIRANIPSRIALRTITHHDSRIILGEKGAESLLGKGDALVSLSTSQNLENIQCPLIDNTIINNILKEKNL